MTWIKEQLALLREFMKTDFRKTIRWSAITMAIIIAAGYILAAASPQAVEGALSFFAQMIEESGVVNEDGSLSLFPLLANNWRAMLVSALYGFAPFIYMPVFSLAANSVMLGIMARYYQTSGLSMALYLAGIIPHGIFELPALVLAISCGVYLCRHMSLWVLRYEKRIPLPQLLESLLRVMLFLVLPMSAAAAVIETYLTPVIMSFFL